VGGSGDEVGGGLWFLLPPFRPFYRNGVLLEGGGALRTEGSCRSRGGRANAEIAHTPGLLGPPFPHGREYKDRGGSAKGTPWRVARVLRVHAFLDCLGRDFKTHWDPKKGVKSTKKSDPSFLGIQPNGSRTFMVRIMQGGTTKGCRNRKERR